MNYKKLITLDHKIDHNFHLRVEDGKLITRDRNKGVDAGEFDISEKDILPSQALHFYSKAFSATPQAAAYLDTVLFPEEEGKVEVKESIMKDKIVKCASFTQAGKRCKNKALHGKYCATHKQ